MMSKTKLYHGLMAVLRNDNWVVISPNFDEVLRIPENEIDDPKVFTELEERDFFKLVPVTDSEPDVSLVTLITTSNCNLRCKYCFANSGESVKNMSEEIAFAAIDRGIKNAFGKKLAIAFFGGEPSLTAGLITKVVDYAKQAVAKNSNILGVEFSITTNGTLSGEFLKFVVENDFLITLSADGPSIVQNYQRPFKGGNGSSDRVDDTIRYLAKHGARFKIRVTVTEYSVNYMAETVVWLSKLGGEKIHFESVSVAGHALTRVSTENLGKPSAEDFVQNLQAAIIKGGELGVSVINSSYMNIAEPPRKYCDGNIDNRFAVSYTGDITTCVEVQERNHPAAQQFIAGKYNHDLKKIVIESNKHDSTCSILSERETVSECSSCFAKKICGKGCPVRNFHTTGDTVTVDPYRCYVIREMVPFIVGLFDEATFGN